MESKRKKLSVEKRKLKELMAFPHQADFFNDLSQHDLQNLANDISENGLREPIEILPVNRAGLPANTIISGHQRKRALELNGQTEADVVFRHDLADADAATIERVFLEANQNRRHLDPLSKAKVALRLFEIERTRSRGKLRPSEHADARDRVGKAIQMSGRNLQRYFCILRAPDEVQDAFRKKQLSLVDTAKIANLTIEDQKLVAKRIRAGKSPKAVLKEFIGEPDKRHRQVGDALASFVRNLERGYQDLDGRIEEIRPAQVVKQVRQLKKGRRLIRQVLERADPAPPS